MPYRYNPLPKQFDRIDITTVPDDVLKEITTDVRDSNYLLTPGTVIPSSNTVQLLGRDTIEESDYGIRTDANPENGNICFLALTNRVRASSTLGAGSTDVVTINLGSIAGVYNFQGYISCFDSVTPSGAGFSIFGSVRTTGAAGTLIGVPDLIGDKETALNNLDFTFAVSANNGILRATNTTGLSVDVKVLINYIFVG